MNIKNFMDITGIDLIPYAIGVSKFISKPPFEPTKLSDINENIQGLNTEELDEALKYSKEILDEENARGEKAESKTYNLIGVTGISAAFITGFSSLFPKETQLISPLLTTLIITFYILIVISLTLTVLLASRAVTVRSYTRPDIANIFQMRKQSLQEAKSDRLATYIYCYSKNCQTHNIKVSYVIGAQLWFRNSVVFFLILAFILITSLIGNTKNNNIPNAETPSPTATIQITHTDNLSTATSQPTNTTMPNKTMTSVPFTASPVFDASTTITISP